MCVTNISKKNRIKVMTRPSPTPSLISQRLMSNFLPTMSTASTPNAVETCCAMPQHRQQNTVGATKRTKRHRKPQKPGKTAKQNDRHFVVHNYHDHATDQDENDTCEEIPPRRKGGVTISFPTKLHSVLEQVERDGWTHVFSWQQHGRCFLIHKPTEFQELVLPLYFGQQKLTSFQRQLNLYGFCRLSRGKDAGAYYHELFLRGKGFLTKRMLRTKIKGTKFKAASNPDEEPDFYAMTPLPPTFFQGVVSDDSSSDDVEPGLQGPNIDDWVSNMSSNQGYPFNSAVSPTMADTMINPLPMHAPAAPILSFQTYSHQFVDQSNMAYQMNRPVSFLASSPHTIASDMNPTELGLSSYGQSSSDEILDQAVDEVFFDYHKRADYLPEFSQASEISEVWDSTEFGLESPENDLQLGFLLDSFLQE